MLHKKFLHLDCYRDCRGCPRQNIETGTSWFRLYGQDTRILESNQCFFAIKGENFDAHQLVSPELSPRECIGEIANRVCKNWDKGFVQINGDTLVSLINMANYAREKSLGTLIGVTGSTGNTTTKAMIALCLEDLGEVYQSHGNWNTRIGFALSLIGLPRSTRVAILEIGMSRKGDILELAKMGRPNIRIILNVGASHLENFGNLEEVAMTKGEILEEAIPVDVSLDADDPLVMGLHVRRGVKKITRSFPFFISKLFNLPRTFLEIDLVYSKHDHL